MTTETRTDLDGPAGATASDVPEGDLLRDLAMVEDPQRPGRFTLEFSPAWNIFYTFGGFTMAAALRAAQLHVDRPDLVPLTAHAVFCSPVGAGPVEIDVDVVRNGRTAANVQADLRQVGHEGADLRLLATFGQEHDTRVTYQGIEFPTGILPPDECPQRPDPAEFSSARPPFPPVNFHRQNDWRPAYEGFTWDETWGREGEHANEFACWFRLHREPRLPDGTIDPISYCVPADMLGPAINRGGRNEAEPFLILSLEIDLQFFATTSSAWTLQRVVSQHAGHGYAFGTTELWDDQRRLLAFVTQRARLRPFAPGEALGPNR